MGYINESIIYNIYPLGFCGAPRDNDGKLVYRLDKIYDCIEHLKKMSVNALVFNPLFESSRHGYDTIDYRKVDCRLGDNNSFKKICKTLHENGIRIILDGVFNHVGRDFFAFKDVQQNLGNSRYCNWFHNLNFGGRSPKGDPFWYEGWAGHYELVKLNLQNDEVVNYLLDSVKFWIDEFDIDGLRLDAADCIDLEFFRKLRNVCKSEKPDFWLYGEIVHGDYNRWANSDMLDSVTNYECYKGIYSSHNDHNYFEIAHTIRRQFDENGGIYRGRVLYSFVDNHDVDRIYSKLNDKRHLRPVYTLLYTLPGVPSLYYGSEWGIEGRKADGGDPALRPHLVLEEMEQHPNVPGLAEYLAFLGMCRKEYPVLAEGAYRELMLTNRQYAFARIKDQDAIIIAVNNDENPAELYVPVPLQADEFVNLESKEVLRVENGRIRVQLPAGGSALLVPVRR